MGRGAVIGYVVEVQEVRSDEDEKGPYEKLGPAVYTQRVERLDLPALVRLVNPEEPDIQQHCLEYDLPWPIPPPHPHEFSESLDLPRSLTHEKSGAFAGCPCFVCRSQECVNLRGAATSKPLPPQF